MLSTRELARIEAEARQMRAEAIAATFRALFRRPARPIPVAKPA